MNNRMEKACYNIILNSGRVPKKDLDRIFEESEKSATSSFSQLLVQSGLLKEAEMLQIYSKNLGTPYVSLKSMDVDRVVFSKIPVKFASYYKFFPVHLEQNKLTIAVSRLLDVHILDEIRFGLGYDVAIVFALEKDIEEMLNRHYGLGADTVDRMMSQSPKDGVKFAAPQAEQVEDIEALAGDASVGQLVNQIIRDAYKKRASDIHIEPFRESVRIRYRVDGVLQDAQAPAELKKFILPLLSRIKIMANLNIVERRLPQDGKARVKTQDQVLDLRVSSMPTPHGESMVIRILPNKIVYTLGELGFEPDHLKVFGNLIESPHGIVFVTGPTGSGKSTTLYAGLNLINTVKRKVITIEDPVEYELPGITQIQVAPDIGLTFARGLRSMLRHDPDVMMVGEVRDLETANIAIRAALTGHLLFSTLHTNDAASGATRLLDIGVEPYLAASSVTAFVAQRLVRLICHNCKEGDPRATREVIELIRADLGLSAEEPVNAFSGKGCDDCSGQGFSGRVAVHEILLVSEPVRKLIFARATAEEIKRKARALGMRTLRQSGWIKVLKGLTTIEEIVKTTPEDEAEEEQHFPQEKETVAEVSMMQAPEAASQADIKMKPSRKSGERRKHERGEIKTRITYRSVDLDGDEQTIIEQLTQWDKEGVTEDMSAGGLAFVTHALPARGGNESRGLEPGKTIELKIDLPDNGEPIEAMGRILRVTPLEKSPSGQNLIRVAVAFLAITSADRSRIEHFFKQGSVSETV